MIFKYALRNIKTLEILKQCKFQQLIFWVFSFFILKTSHFIMRSAYFPSICIFSFDLHSNSFTGRNLRGDQSHEKETFVGFQCPCQKM